MKLSEAIEGYTLDISSRGYSPLTIRSNTYYLGIMAKYLGDCDVSQITTDDLKRFVVYMQKDYVPVRPNGNKDPLGPAALDNVTKSIKSFCKFLSTELGLPRPDAAIKSPRYQQPEIVPYTEEEVKRIVKACSKAGKRRRKTALRDTLIVLILIDTGIRLGELARLKIKDLNVETGELYVRPFRSSIKSRPRTIPVGASTRRAAWHYLHSRDDRKPEDPLFTTSERHAVTDSQIQNLLHDIGLCAGVENCGPHRFRHTFAIEFLRNGGDVFTLKRLLGHSSLEMVNYYLSFVQADLESVHRRASPADRWRL